jgi:ABC-2 type transport system permease protein
VTRVFLTGMRVQLVQLLRSSFDLVAMLVWPIVYSSIAYYLLGAQETPRRLLSAAIASAVMLMWSQVVVGSSNSLDMMRQNGTLELVVAAPVPLVSVLAPVMLTSGAFGLYGLLVTLVWGRLAFGIPLEIAHPLAFVVSIPACVVAIGALGMIVASTFVLYRAAFALGIAMQYPVWIASGLLVPLSALPGWLGPVSWTLAPAWGFRAIERAAVGGDAWPAIGWCGVVSLAYLAVTVVCLRGFEHLARSRATLRLA